ncbi:DUF4476 domain-containing protein [Archangium sp.]|jgi:hypothetical protein|uniref:DUF4476 domain-containing protein n=1 Tax=Archangium sp. TaxID=1872627 RepID=UPI002ED874E2
MKAVLIALVTLLAVPALAQVPSQNGGGGDMPPPAQLRPAHGNPGTPGFPAPQQGTPVVMDRDALMQQLARINERLTATGKLKKDKQLQKLIDEARADLKEVARQVSSAPLARVEPQRPPQPPPPPSQPAVQPITEAMLRSLVVAIRNEPFADDQLSVLEEAAPTQYFLVAQAQQILRVFNFSKDRLKAMRLLRPRLLDTENGYKLYESFEFSNDKDELKRILAAQQ